MGFSVWTLWLLPLPVRLMVSAFDIAVNTLLIVEVVAWADPGAEEEADVEFVIEACSSAGKKDC